MANKPDVKAISALLDDLQKIDPLGVIVITAAGVAGACGKAGPLTTLMAGISGGKSSTSVGGVDLVGLVVTPVGVFQGLDWLSKTLSGQNNGQTPLNASDEEKKQMLASIGTAASNMVEAGIMYTLVRNPETLRTLFDMSKESVKGAVGLAKGVGALGAL